MLYKLLVYAAKIQVWSASVGHPVDYIFFSVTNDKKSIFGNSILKSMNRIKEVLEEKGIKQKWLAEKLGKSYNMVNGYVQK